MSGINDDRDWPTAPIGDEGETSSSTAPAGSPRRMSGINDDRQWPTAPVGDEGETSSSTAPAGSPSGSDGERAAG